ncbi:MAG: diguanylate cyclase [Chloroflexi bacterium]|nr:diguanylate cyclase [Chloroflexota bacterium]
MPQLTTASSAVLIPTTLFLIALIYGILGLYGWRHRDLMLARIFTWIMLAMGLWTLLYGFEISSRSLPWSIFWAKTEYLGIVFIPVYWLAFSLVYTGRANLLTTRNWILLFIIPILTLLLVWTNEMHRLIWVTTGTMNKGGLILLDVVYGPMFYFAFVYFYILLVGGSGMTIISAMRLPPLYRGQAITTIVAMSFPMAGNIFYVAVGSDIDLTTFFFLPTGIALAWAIGRYRLLDVIPPAQNIILQNLHDGILLLDRRRRVIYLNSAAETIFSRKSRESVGYSFEEVNTECNAAVVPLLAADAKATEITLATMGSLRQFEIRVLPMETGSKSMHEAASHLVILHDVTERRIADTSLKRRDAILRVVNLVAGEFLRSPNWEKNVPTVLEQLGTAALASRAYIFERHISENGVPLVSQRYEWVAEDIQSHFDDPGLQNLAWVDAGFARWEEYFEQGKIIAGKVKDLPVAEQELLVSQNILSIVAVPIILDENLWGFVGFDDCLREREWTDAELGALRAAADIFGAALMRREIELRLLQRQHSQELLQEIISATLGKRDLVEVSQFLVDHLSALIRAEKCFLTLWDEATQRVLPMASYGSLSDDYRQLVIQPIQKSLTASALDVGHILVVDDAQHSIYVDPELAKQFGVHSVLVIPMTSNEARLGAILLGFSYFHRFTPDEIILSEEAANLAALAIAKFRAVEEAQKRVDEAESLQRAVTTVAESLNLQEATSRLLEQLAYVLPHDSASVQLLREGELEIINGEGWTNASSVIGLRFPVPGDNPNTKVIESGEPVLLRDTYEEYPIFRTLDHASHIRSWLGVPLIVRSRVIGLLAIDSRETNHFTHDNIQLVSAFASQVAIAIENARLFDEVQQMAITDGLTGLYNRRHFMELAQIEFERARRYKRHLSAIMFDIDHFKKVNDTYGHPFGDLVLQNLAALCKVKLREVDPIARYGGEEFVALVVEANIKHAELVGERLRREVEKMVTHHGTTETHITVSIGIAEQDENTATLEDLIARADQALYYSKHHGRNRVTLAR